MLVNKLPDLCLSTFEPKRTQNVGGVPFTFIDSNLAFRSGVSHHLGLLASNFPAFPRHQFRELERAGTIRVDDLEQIRTIGRKFEFIH